MESEARERQRLKDSENPRPSSYVAPPYRGGYPFGMQAVMGRSWQRAGFERIAAFASEFGVRSASPLMAACGQAR